MMLQAAVLVGLLFGAEAKVNWRPKSFSKKAPPPPPAAAVNRTTTEEDYWTQWNEFRRVENKPYLTQAHHDERYEIFKDNIDKINRHNAQNLSWKMGVTPFADLTEEEFKTQIVGDGYCTLPERKNEDNVIELDTSSNPTAIDWNQQGKVTPVKNQGQCGSCWAFSTTGAIEARYAIAKGQSPVELSEQELVDCAGSEGNNGCRGGLMDYGFEYVEQQHGLCSESSFPYVAKTETRQCNALRSACGQKLDPITNHADVKSRDSAALEAAVAQGPVSVAIEADQSAFQLYKSGVLTGRCGAQLDHGVLCVGYSNEGSQHWWNVKNSWGDRWGENGYIRLCKDCNANRGQGQCGILGQPSYPIVE